MGGKGTVGWPTRLFRPEVPGGRQVPEQQRAKQGLGLEPVQELWPLVSPGWSLDQQPAPEHSQGHRRGCAGYLGEGHGELLAAVTPTLQRPLPGSLTGLERHRHGSHSRICYRMGLGELDRAQRFWTENRFKALRWWHSSTGYWVEPPTIRAIASHLLVPADGL